MSKLDISSFVSEHFNAKDFSHLHWEGSFQDYVDLVTKDPRITRNAFQRVHDMIMGFGTSKYTEYKKEITRYHFFDDPFDNGKDAVFGIDVHLMKLVNFFKSASAGYGLNSVFNQVDTLMIGTSRGSTLSVFSISQSTRAASSRE